MTRQHVLFLYNSISGGGLARRMILFANILVSSGLNVTIAGATGNLEYLIDNRINKLYLKKYNGNYFIFFFANFYILFKYCSKNKIDLISNHGRNTIFLSILMSKLKNVKYLYVDHGVKKFMRIFTFSKLWDCNILSVSYGSASSLVKEYHVNKEHIKVIQNTTQPMRKLDLNEIKNIKEQYSLENKKVISCIALFNEAKNHEFLVNAWALVNKKFGDKVHLLLVGKGEKKKNIEKKIKILDLEDTISLLPYDTNVNSIIAISEFTVLTSVREGLPTVVLESFSASKTVVASKISGTDEIVKSGENGYLYEPNNYDDFVNKVSELLKDENLLKRFNKNAYITYVEEFDFKSYISKIRKFYLDLLKKNNIGCNYENISNR